MRRQASIVVAALLAAFAAMPFGGAFSGWGFVVTTIGAGLVVAAVSLLADRYQLLVGEAVAAFIVVFFLVGAAITGGFGNLIGGATDGWADLLSTTPPAESPGRLFAVPFAATFLGAAIGAELARSTRWVAMPAVGAALTLLLAILVTPEERRFALIAGCIFVAGLLALMWLRSASTSAGASGDEPPLRGALTTMAVLVLVAGLAAMLGPRLPGADSHERFDLRRYQRNNFDPLDTPSPLVTFKASLATATKDNVVFSVAGDQPINRFPLATMAVFDGVVWAVADGSQGMQREEFVPVSTNLPDQQFTQRGEPVELTFTIGELSDPWLPRTGWVTKVDTERDDIDLRLNLDTGTLAVNGGLTSGETFTIWSQPVQTAAQLDAAIGGGFVEDVDRFTTLPGEFPLIVNLFGEITEGAPQGLDRAFRIQDHLRNEGFYLQDDTAFPGHSYRRITSFLGDRVVKGYGEQYAAAAAVLSRAGDIPSRVVVGYQIEPERWQAGQAEVRAGDISAWIEVLVEGAGWVAFDVTPDKNQTPEPEPEGVVYESVAIPNPPPPPPPQPTPQVDLPTTVLDEDELEEIDDEDDDDTGGSGRIPLAVVIGGAAIGVPVLLALLGIGVIVALKARRRGKRRQGAPRQRVIGAWTEVRDRFTDAGLHAGKADTPHEAVTALAAASKRAELAIDEPELRQLASAVDRAAYAPTGVDDEMGDQSWVVGEDLVKALKHQHPWWKRLLMAGDPRSLR